MPRDASGSTPAAQCVDWGGAVAGEGFSVAGNMLANERVIQETAQAFQESQKAFAERLIAALEAGEAAGGDKRGKQSAALLICSTEDYPELNLRVDDHADPLVELAASTTRRTSASSRISSAARARRGPGASSTAP